MWRSCVGLFEPKKIYIEYIDDCFPVLVTPTVSPVEGCLFSTFSILVICFCFRLCVQPAEYCQEWCVTYVFPRIHWASIKMKRREQKASYGVAMYSHDSTAKCHGYSGLFKPVGHKFWVKECEDFPTDICHSKTTRALVFLAYWLNLEQYHTKKAWLERLTEDALSNFRRSHFLITIHSLAWEAFIAKLMIARIQRLLVQLVHTSAVNRRSNRRSFNRWVWSWPSWGTDVENVKWPRETWRWKQVTLMWLTWSSCDFFSQRLNLFLQVKMKKTENAKRKECSNSLKMSRLSCQKSSC